ncbi:DUF2339 domain-containing protein [Sphingomonas sp. LY54]|uniref:DUF2339 domain-containing protein n=1 Tax=Sphingomonas sp. LY54 TaxID=3095343 RepID=UPI002D78E46B|nr:DUF2339 domain-containing protein [Sphingomonas sp. LY54]WRP27522.1 DUF2339 domain-containing protein [Sphingomonas sp. LY54]
MIELLLLVGLVALFAAHRKTSLRLARLEEQLDALGHALHPPAEPTQAVRAYTVQRAAPEPATEPPARAEEWTEPPAEEPALPVRETFAILFERFVGGRLLIWVGGIALAVAGVFLVRYSIEIGLVTPPVRMAMAGAFGLLLIAGGEIARSRPGFTADPRVAQTLVGAGIFVLYAATYGSLTLYGLMPVGVASALMALITAAALVLALRHGAPTAVMGLTGGFLTPLLVGDPNASAVPLLAYLALLNAALFALAQRRGWTWLAAGAVVLSFLWSAALLMSRAPDALAAGVFIVAMGIAASLARPGEGRHLHLLQPAAIGLLQLAVLVARTDLGVAAWALFGTLALASLVLATRREEYRLLPPLALLLALVLLAAKSLFDSNPILPWAAAATALLFTGFAWPLAARDGSRLPWTAVACAALAAPALILRAGEGRLLAGPVWGALMLLLAVGPAVLAWRHRGEARAEGQPDLPLLIAGATSALLLMAAAYDLLPNDLMPAGWALVALAAAGAARRLRDVGLAMVALAVSAAAATASVLLVPELWATIGGSLIAEPAFVTALPTPAAALQSLALTGALLLAVWRVLPPLAPLHARALPTTGAALLAAAGYILFKQVFAIEDRADFDARGFAERMVLTQTLFLAGWLLASGTLRDARLAERLPAWGMALTLVAAARLIWFDLILHNPVLTPQWIGPLPLLNLILPAFIGSAFWLHLARRRGGRWQVLWLILFLGALIAGVMLLVRQAFHGATLTAIDMPVGERYGYSLAGLLLSVGLLGAGVRMADKPLRLAGLLLLTATVLKVFLVDAAALEGVLRILSFLGLGIALIGVGKLYTSVLAAEARTA